MKIKWTFRLTIISMVFSILAMAQEGKIKIVQHNNNTAYVSKTYTINNGLPSKNTTAALKDKMGFIWVGTENGLCKFDGYSFKTYVNIAGDSHSLSNNYINSIIEDYDGTFWVGTMNGLNRFDPKTEKFDQYFHTAGAINSLSNDKIWCMYLDSKHRLWVGTDDGFNMYNRQKMSFITYQTDVKNPYAMKGKAVNAIKEDRTGNLWLGNWSKGLNKFDPNTKRFTNYRQAEISNQKNPNDIWTLCIDDEGIIWIGSYWKGSLFRFDPITERFSNHLATGTGNTAIYNILNISHSKLLVGGDAGVFWVNTDTNKWEKIEGVEYFAYGGLYRDPSGLIWISGKNGLSKIDFNQYKFSFSPISFDNAEVKSMVYHENFYWIGTNKGLFKYNSINRSVEKKVHSSNSNSLSSDRIVNLAVDLKKQLWVLGENGFDLYNDREQIFIHHTHRSPIGAFFNEDVFRDLIEANNGVYYLATDAGLKIYDKKTKTYTHYINDPKNPNSLSNNHLNCLLKDTQNNIWIGTYGGGVSRFNPSTKAFTNYKTNNAIKNSISNNLINYLYLDSRKNIWILTSDGLNKYNPKADSFEVYSKQEGFASNVFSKMIEDNQGKLWVTTELGISLFDPVSKSVKNYDEKDGVYANSTICKNSNGEIYLAGNRGLVYFNPKDLHHNQVTPPIYFSDLSIFNKTIVPGKNSPLKLPIYMTREIRLPYNQTVLSFGFVALNYTLSEKNQYAYFLEGFDKKWNYIRNEHKVTYTNLSPGTYTLKVRASNNDGVWNMKGNELRIIITPPWYATWWAFCLYGFALIGLIYAYIHYREHQAALKFQIRLAQMEGEKEKELSEKKLSFFTNISHEFRTPLTLIINPVKELLYKNDKNLDTSELNIVYRNAKRLLSLVDQLLLFRKADTYTEKLKIAPLDIVGLCKEIVLCFMHQAKSKNIGLVFNCSEESLIVYADKEKLEIVFFNLLSNALKFTPEGGLVTMSITGYDKKVQIEVIDTGCGIKDNVSDKLYTKFYQEEGSKSSKGGFGIGLFLAKKFVEMHGGDISHQRAKDKGTVFTIILSKGTAHLDSTTIYEEEIANAGTSLFHELIEEEIFVDQQTPVANIQSDQLVQDLNTIIVIDDNKEIREYLKQIFKGEYQILETDSGESGYQLVKEILPDIVISDVMMEGMSGIELCAKIKEDAVVSHIPIILLTAISAPEVKLKGIEGGADDYISKPFDKDFLKARVASILKSKNALQKYFYNEVTLNANNTKISVEYKEFLDSCIKVVEKHLVNPEFNIDVLAADLGMSRSNLYRRIKSVSGQSANGFIRFIRLRKAAEIFINTDNTIQQTAYLVGMNDPKYFRAQFSKLFNMNPSQYIKKYRKFFSNNIQLSSNIKKLK